MNKQTPLLWAAILAAFSCQSFAQPPAVKESAGVQWVCGGVSEEGRRELAEASFPANLSLTFATTETRAYIADVRVSVFDAGVKSARMSFVAEGPICLVKAPPGRYRIEAAYGGTTRSATTAVAAGAGRAHTLVFAFPEGPTDGIRSDAEERREEKRP